MAIIFSDLEISSLLDERKQLPDDWRNRIRFSRQKLNHEEGFLNVTGDSGNDFRIIARRNTLNQLDFSVILAVQVQGTNRLFRLRRHNGRSHEHTNRIEQQTFYDFHIHYATERYQALGMREDGYAEVTDRYGAFHQALDCLIRDANFIDNNRQQLSMF